MRGSSTPSRGGFVPPSFRGTRGFPPARGGAYPPFRGGYSNTTTTSSSSSSSSTYPGYGSYTSQQTTPVVDQATRLKKLANCEDDEELWVEAESPEGKPYFYHWQTRETVWDRPEKSKVVGQTELAELIQKASEEERKEREGSRIARSSGIIVCCVEARAKLDHPRDRSCAASQKSSQHSFFAIRIQYKCCIIEIFDCTYMGDSVGVSGCRGETG
ncbi:unnamed protein product [Strongylus vulgaris]|uniref:WW domain-containing protein n=1 Tax=Strongylus vulgaris TaxID=40348 RepID=A0A3P7I6Y9_STRVU|nr:unnamed protein product [Strongylus vulgaris]